MKPFQKFQSSSMLSAASSGPPYSITLVVSLHVMVAVLERPPQPTLFSPEGISTVAFSSSEGEKASWPVQ